MDQVEIRTLDSLALDQLHFLKVDVEGMEQSVLLGAAATIQRHRPVIYTENDRDEKSADLIQTLLDMDYRIYWHFPFLFSPDNLRGNPENIFDGSFSRNLLCLPKESSITVEDLDEVTDQHDLQRRLEAPGLPF